MSSTTEKAVEDEEPFGLGCALEHFTEANEIFQIIDNLKTTTALDLSASEKIYEKYHVIVGQYKEQPHLLDPHLDQLLEKLISIVRAPDSNAELRHKCFRYMFVVVNVRGYKVVVRHLPHEVNKTVVLLQFTVFL